MKFLIGALGLIVIVAALNWPQTQQPITKTLTNANIELSKVIAAPATESIEKLKQRMVDESKRNSETAKAAEKVKIYVPARDTKTCMKILKTDVINNSVIECNKDRTVEVRRDEIENFKIKQGIN